MRHLSVFCIAVVSQLSASCSPSAPAPTGAAPAIRQALLTQGVAFLESKVDSIWPELPRGPVFLGAARLESPNQLHGQEWLKETARSTDGLCHPPEAQCFRGQTGRVLALGLPRMATSDTIILTVAIRVFEPYPIDPRAQLPPNLRPAEPLTRWTATFAWTLRALAESADSIRIVRVTGPIRTPVRP